ncbi:hypothetical protein METBIDRAFT_30072 [Metschnikowia bicuspidata var. bicuspidata NRRL YB-4993]|uniref:V-type proton ATPase subunit S1/VOA1 transmembrane domain-containing protein n=1 Tax=Metschnikowia bicuspidata var. bicuspidata NRRL YB-4993 TaxID=869754 RepID=A0A1A0HI00_9ASCO|nr:hypothetical protein METBIDRAFT_30072 [Metschnikowia bicuspidata var. bicuspidata NRRL YB-4993]OBA23635.1 hypothetical protein METBIDRAFT_30072 [Metschnikowia bicuspidata var. bicuspidata NRRL YB-4993]
MKLTALAACASSAMAFADTAAFFSSQPLAVDGAYITPAGGLSRAFEKLTADFCLQFPGEQLTVFRVGRLGRAAPPVGDAGATFLPHVHYAPGAAVDFPVAPACSVVYLDRAPARASDVSANVIVVDVDDAATHTVAEYLGAGHVVVQGKPAFRAAGSPESFRQLLSDKLHLGPGAPAKRAADELPDADELVGADELPDADELVDAETDFGIAESLIAAQDSAVGSRWGDDRQAAAGAGPAPAGAAAPLNLFTKYQFFTPGVWLVLLVCLFLVYVSLTAVGWITSIELSYRSFEKQVEYEKKTE